MYRGERNQARNNTSSTMKPAATSSFYRPPPRLIGLRDDPYSVVLRPPPRSAAPRSYIVTTMYEFYYVLRVDDERASGAEDVISRMRVNLFSSRFLRVRLPHCCCPQVTKAEAFPPCFLAQGGHYSPSALAAPPPSALPSPAFLPVAASGS